MNKKIFYFSILAMIAVSLSTFTSCKKGENDPFLSLKSRKSRISGEWKLSEGTIVETYSNGINSGASTTTYTSTTSSYDGDTAPYSETLKIEKDGTYEITILDDGDSFSVKGFWFFAGKIKDLDLKKKEAIVLVPQQELELTSGGYSETYNGLYGGEVLIIDQLKNKEIIFKGEFTYSGSGGNTNSTSYDRTFEKQ